MILTTHALIGAALGKNISNPWLVAAIAIPLHFFLDHFRHGEYLNRNSKLRHTWWRVALDLLVGFSIIAGYLFWSQPSELVIFNILFGTFISMFPDLTTMLYWEFRWTIFREIHDFHAWCHRYPPFSKERLWTLRNATNDILFSIIAIIFLLL